MFQGDKKIEERLQLFHEQLCADTYEILGSHFVEDRVIFRVWAPNASAVSVVGDFNGWNADANPMFKVTKGIWEAQVEGLKNYDVYKYAVTDFAGRRVLKADPYARHSQTAPETASRIYDGTEYKWGDTRWRNKVKKTDIYSSPINIYEVHCESWRKYEDGSNFDYVKLAEELSEYVRACRAFGRFVSGLRREGFANCRRVRRGGGRKGGEIGDRFPASERYHRATSLRTA